MNAERPKARFIVLSVVKMGECEPVWGEPGIGAGGIDWEVFVSEDVLVSLVEGYEGILGERTVPRVWRNMF